MKDDLKSLFEPSDGKPFRFFDNEDAGADVDEFGGSALASRAQHKLFQGNDDEDVVDDQVLPTAAAGAAPHRPTFFFSENDPRLADGMRFMTLNPAEMAASLEQWRKTRPQIAADFKKLKKDANRKRKAFDR